MFQETLWTQIEHGDHQPKGTGTITRQGHKNALETLMQMQHNMCTNMCDHAVLKRLWRSELTHVLQCTARISAQRFLLLDCLFTVSQNSHSPISCVTLLLEYRVGVCFEAGSMHGEPSVKIQSETRGHRNSQSMILIGAIHPNSHHRMAGTQQHEV